MTPTETSSRLARLRPYLLAFALFLALAVAITWPLALNLSSALIGHHTGDAYEMGHHIWWFTHALKTGQPLFYQTLMGYPDGIQGVSLWADPLQFFPAWLFAFVMPVAAAYNLIILLTMALNGVAMAYLVSRIGPRAGMDCAARVNSGPALIAGAAFMAFPVFQARLFGGHAGLVVMWPVPLYVDALLSLRDGFTRGRFIRAVIWFVVSPWGHTLQAIYVLMPVTGLFVLAQLIAREWRGALRTVAVALIGALLLMIFVLPVASDTFADETYTGDQGYVAFSADLLGLVTPSFESPALGWLPHTRPVLGVNVIEGLTYYGVAAALLTALAVWKVRESRWWLALLIVAAVLALGPIINILGRPTTLRLDNVETFVTTPWAWLYNLPGFSLARTPGRFSFTVALAAGVLIGCGAMVLWVGRWRYVAVALAALTLVEYQSFWPFPTVDAAIPEPIAALRDDPDIRAVMHVPWGNLLAAKEAIYLQTAYQKPMIAGQVTRRTPVDPAKLTILEETLDPSLLDTAGVDVVVLHKRYGDSGTLRLMLGAPEYEDDRFAVYRVPDTSYTTGFRAQSIGGFGDTSGGRSVTDRLDLYFFLSEPGVVDLALSMRARGGRNVTLSLEGQHVHEWTLDGAVEERVPLFADAGYHTVTLTLDPACPSLTPSAALMCQDLRVSEAIFTPTQTLEVQRVALDGGIVMTDGAVDSAVLNGSITAHFVWHFDSPQAETTVRFVKVLTPDGAEIVGVDEALGSFEAGETWAETVTIPLPEGSLGPYEVYTGWYIYPDLARFPVQGEGKRAQDGLIYLGTIYVASAD